MGRFTTSNLIKQSGGLKLVRLQDRIWYRCDWKFTGSNPVLATQKTMNGVSLPCRGWVLKVQTVRWRNW